MSKIKIQEGFSPYTKEVKALQDLLDLYHDGTLPYDKGDVEVLEDKLEFIKKKEIEDIERAMNPKQFRRYLKMIKIILWIRKINPFIKKTKVIDE